MYAITNMLVTLKSCDKLRLMLLGYNHQLSSQSVDCPQWVLIVIYDDKWWWLMTIWYEWWQLMAIDENWWWFMTIGDDWWYDFCWNVRCLHLSNFRRYICHTITPRSIYEFCIPLQLSQKEEKFRFVCHIINQKFLRFVIYFLKPSFH